MKSIPLKETKHAKNHTEHTYTTLKRDSRKTSYFQLVTLMRTIRSQLYQKCIIHHSL